MYTSEYITFNFSRLACPPITVVRSTQIPDSQIQYDRTFQKSHVNFQLVSLNDHGAIRLRQEDCRAEREGIPIQLLRGDRL